MLAYITEAPRHTMLLKRPCSRRGELWTTALPGGNGLTGVLMHGAVSLESIQLNRHDLWHGGGRNGELPDITSAFCEMREAILGGKYHEANGMLSRTLGESGYLEGISRPYPLGMLTLNRKCASPFREYRRGIRMDRAELFTVWREGDIRCERRMFVSRFDDTVYMRQKGVLCDSYTIGPLDLSYCPKADADEIRSKLRVEYLPGGAFTYQTALGGISYGAVGRIIGGDITVGSDSVTVAGDHTIVIKTYRGGDGEAALQYLRSLSDSNVYENALNAHLGIYAPIYKGVSIELASDEDHRLSNEDMLDEAYDSECSPAMLERLWRYGRYLFISGTHEEGNPFPLYGLWHGNYNLVWAQNIANENVQLIYHHADAGGLSYAVRGLIRYYYEMIPKFEENARRLFGCRGIYIPAYTAPGCSGPSVNVPVILNWISCAGWLSSHFASYYRYTGDRETLISEILPFMYRSAQFYEDYLIYDADGKCVICPSVSPENTPGNLMPEDPAYVMGHPCPAVRDALMDHAVLRELMTNLIELSLESGLVEYKAMIPKWKQILDSIPQYSLNHDGAVREWLFGELEDNYTHRHLSHLYPVYPGNEILPDDTSLLASGFKKAVLLREIGSQSGWSFPHMANILVRLGMGEEALCSIDNLAKGCLLDNFFTVHNDWRHMGVSLEMRDSPVQLDALMGTVEVIEELALRFVSDKLYILPSETERFRNIRANGIRFPYGSVSFDRAQSGAISVEIHAERNASIIVVSKGKSHAVDLIADQKYTLFF